MRTSNAWLWMTIHEDTVSVAKQFPVKGIELCENHEPAHARNFGSKCSSADILIFIDSDVLIFPETISKIVQAFQEHKDVAAIIGSYDDQPHETSLFRILKICSITMFIKNRVNSQARSGQAAARFERMFSWKPEGLVNHLNDRRSKILNSDTGLERLIIKLC